MTRPCADMKKRNCIEGNLENMFCQPLKSCPLNADYDGASVTEGENLSHGPIKCCLPSREAEVGLTNLKFVPLCIVHSRRSNKKTSRSSSRFAWDMLKAVINNAQRIWPFLDGS